MKMFAATVFVAAGFSLRISLHLFVFIENFNYEK